jgi:carbon storage regulator
MLVIRRRQGESLYIGDDVEVSILEITGSQVKLGIQAPREVAVLRAEIRVTAEQNREAAQLLPESAFDNLRGCLQDQARRSMQRDEGDAP